MRVCIGHPGYISEMVRLIPAQAVLQDGTALYEPIVPFLKRLKAVFSGKDICEAEFYSLRGETL